MEVTGNTKSERLEKVENLGAIAVPKFLVPDIRV